MINRDNRSHGEASFIVSTIPFTPCKTITNSYLVKRPHGMVRKYTVTPIKGDQ